MDSIPKHFSLASQMTTSLRESLRAGTWKDFLPGEFELCRRFQVSRSTMRAALIQLQREGWLKNHQGKRREIVRKRVLESVIAPGKLVVMLSPVPLQKMDATTLFWTDSLRDHLAAIGYRLAFQTVLDYQLQRPELALESLVHNLRPAGWVLHWSSTEIQQWFSERGLPCVIVGSRHRHMELSSVDVDHAAICSHAANLLAAKGRRRLALLMPRSGHAGDLESEFGFIEAGKKFKPQGVQTLVAHHDGSVLGICRALDKLLRGTEPALGILVAKTPHVVTAVTHLLRRGVRMPKDVSLISRDDDPLLENFVPSITRYHVDPVLFARKASRLVVDVVRSSGRRRHDSRLMAALVPGETLS